MQCNGSTVVHGCMATQCASAIPHMACVHLTVFDCGDDNDDCDDDYGVIPLEWIIFSCRVDFWCRWYLTVDDSYSVRQPLPEDPLHGEPGQPSESIYLYTTAISGAQEPDTGSSVRAAGSRDSKEGAGTHCIGWYSIRGKRDTKHGLYCTQECMRTTGHYGEQYGEHSREYVYSHLPHTPPSVKPRN